MKNSKLTSFSLVILQFLFVGIIAFSGPVIPSKLMWALLFWSGIGLGIWAILTMKIGNFNIIPDVKNNGKMVISGPYRHVRHPMYSALLLSTLAEIGNAFSPLRLTMWMLLFIILLFKLHYEERLLFAHFPEYPAYAARTKRLFPFLI
ncbi:MAG: isoprenylcysteine carboxylmethyltransferase family protein [Calditrichia bacterium]